MKKADIATFFDRLAAADTPAKMAALGEEKVTELIRTIGLARAQVKIGLMNLTYNLMRYLQLSRRGTSMPAAA